MTIVCLTIAVVLTRKSLKSQPIYTEKDALKIVDEVNKKLGL